MIEDTRNLRQHGDAIFARLSPYEGAGLRNHCLRIYEYAGMLSEHDAVPLDDGLTYLMTMVHDLGLVCDEHGGKDYMERTRNLFRHEARERKLDLTPHELQVADECLLLNHRLVAPAGMAPETEVFRRAVQIEHSMGALRHGLGRAALAAIRRQHPRDNFNRVLIDFARRVVLHEPGTLVRGIFF